MSDSLVDSCKATGAAAREALDWFADPSNAEKVGQERRELDREFRRFATQARKLANAATRPMCVGVFGPSQAGKSYLVSVLARDGEKPLMARFSGEEDKDFISQINPGGERESTGIVTRFTIHETAHPEGFPVCLRLLSQSDIVKILGNAYLMEGDPKKQEPMTPSDLEDLLEAGRARVGSPPDDQMTEEDVWDIQEYFQKHFGHQPAIRALTDYWDDASELAPRLDIEGRAALFAPLWGHHEPLSRLYVQLVEALVKLGHAGEAFCRMDALIPREKSIIDVATLGGLGNPEAAELEVRPMSGSPVSLPRPVVTALIAELRIVIAEKPWPFFDHTDLLDFPGARSRQRIDLVEFFERQSDALKELLLRGKVAYLFDRYVAEQELTSMLLCIGPSNQEVTTLPDMIDEWIGVTHGQTPQERAGRDVVLYFVLTQFDRHFIEKAGDDEDELGSRFAGRMFSSLTGFFGKAHEWPKNWAGGEPFRNCFWLRNPHIKSEFLIKYDGRREVSLLPEKQERLEALKRAYLQIPDVRDHFADSERAWDEALKLNDGGVSYLAESLAPVCEPTMKRRQVAGRLTDLRQRMTTRIRGFHISDDVDKRLEERRAVADRVIGSLEGAADAGRFGPLLRELQIDCGSLEDHLYRVQRQPSQNQDDSGEQSPAPRPARSRFGRRRATEENADQISGSGSGAPEAPRNREELHAQEMLSLWIRIMRQAAESDRVSRSLAMPAEDLSEIASELAGGARRLNLARRIADRLRSLAFIEHPDRMVGRAAIIGYHEINGFVSTLGFADRAEDERPEVEIESGKRRAFAKRPAAWTSDVITETPVAPAEDFLLDWGYSFMALVDENASSSDGQLIDVEQNVRIGRILEALTERVSE